MDPHADYAEMQRRAEIQGSIAAAARGEVVEVRSTRLFAIENDELFVDRLWVLSNSRQQVQLGEEVVAEGILHRLAVEDIEGRYAADFPDDVELALRDEAVLVADTITTYVDDFVGRK